MSSLIFLLPILGLIALFGLALRAPHNPVPPAGESAFSFASENN